MIRPADCETSEPVHLTIVSNLPPPIHGVSIFNQMLLTELDRNGIPYTFHQVGSARNGDKIGRASVAKILRDCRVLWKLVMDAASSPKVVTKVLYFTPCQGGPGVCRDVLLGLIGRALFDRVVTHMHGCGWINIYGENRVRGWLMLNALRSSDSVICLGPSFSKRMRETTTLNCVPINNGTTPIVGACSKRLPDDGLVHLLFLGSLLTEKGLWIAAGATRVLRSRGRNVVLHCAGQWRCEGDESRFREAFRAELKEESIEVMGPVTGSAKEDLLRLSHFLVLPTTYPREGQPLVIVEGMSCGAIPMTTNHGGIADLLRFSGGDRLCSATFVNEESLASGIEWFVESPERFGEMSRACYEHFIRNLTFSDCVERLLAVMRQPTRASIVYAGEPVGGG